jgi:tetratricopeptide (TPR) repeat protein
MAIDGLARPKLIAELSSTLADVQYSLEKFDEAAASVRKAIDAADSYDNHTLVIKLSNNLGAVLRKTEKITEALELHQSTFERARTHLVLSTH